ncbi:MAG: UDP-2,3-diacylglucosamine diphosphatase LpxI [Candidatus Binatia bacterium]|nr:UDP-2,3-diacylglucosamine diphosphatase LpxI [Candidatus Binatia bacterium]
MQRIGLIAGNGRFPRIFAGAARGLGYEVVAVAHRGETEPALEREVDQCTWIQVGQLGRIIDVFRAAKVTEAVFVGGIRKQALLEQFAPDERGLAFLGRLAHFGDDAVLRGLAEELEGEGIRILPSTLFLESLLTPADVLTSTAPTPEQWEDIRLGVRVAKAIGEWDIGQTVVVQNRIVLAVEAIEGTDATIARAGRPGAVVVKVSKPQQDLRFDVPAVGPNTIDVCASVGVSVVALEAGKTLLLDKEALLAKADEAGIAVVGVVP